MAGVCYLVGSLASVFGQMIVLGRLEVPGDASATSANILAHESLFRLGFACSLMTVPFHAAWAALFRDLFRPVSRSLSSLAVYLLLMGCTLWALSSLFHLAPLLVLHGSALSAYTPGQLQAIAYLFIKLNAQAYDMGLVFFGLWYIAIGVLIAKCQFLPRVIGVLGIVAGLGYLTLIWRPLAHVLYPYNLALAGPGEISLMGWLLVKGVDDRKWMQAAARGSNG
jgi:hypothetical protein